VRILLFSGKGGVGKTSTAAATGLKLASLGYRTLVMSVDPAHSLSDAFDLDAGLFTSRTADPVSIADKLEIHEVNIQKEIKRHWNEISTYIVGLLRTSGLADVAAEELAIFPGMEELSAMMYVNQFRREGRYDVIVLDCAPTAESLRFISMPTTLEWYIKHIFPTERKLLKLMRPLANRVSPVELPQDSYFANIYDLYQKIEGIDTLLADPLRTSARLVTNAERMVVKETQRAFVYFSLHGLTVDEIIVNRLLPEEAGQGFFAAARSNQQAILSEVERYFAPVATRKVPQFETEVLGLERLRRLADVLYGEGEDPAAVTRTERAYEFGRKEDHYEVRLRLPFAAKSEVGLYKKGDELVVEIGNFRRHVGLPTSMAGLVPVRARLEDKLLVVEMKEAA
jgi:arsenite/tail-anchored protein-transporting ATPase